MERIEEMIQNLELLRMHFGDITKTCMANGIIDSTIKAIEKLATYENAEKHGLPEHYEADEKDTPAKKPQTNADRIRSMTDEELADFLVTVETYGYHDQSISGTYEMKEWLLMESEE